MKRAFGLGIALLFTLTVAMAAAAQAQNFCFDAPASFAAGTQPYAICTADLDNDGRPDLAAANQATGVISLFRNFQNGTFGVVMDLPAGNLPYSILATDLNGDGWPDLAVANAWGDSVGVRLSAGAPWTYFMGMDYPVGDQPYSIVAANLNGDNYPDLAVANAISDDISILINNGNGYFAPAVNYPAGDGPTSICAAKLDTDNDVDLAVTLVATNRVLLMLNNGSGSFAAGQSLAVGHNPRSICAANLDMDSDADLAVANEDDDNVSVLRNNNGVFAAAVNYPAGDRPHCVIAADLNGDAFTDLVTANFAGNTVSVLKNDGIAIFAAPEHFPAGNAPTSVCGGHFDSDLDFDLAVTNYSNAAVSVLNNCAPAACVTMGDVNGDGISLSPSDMIFLMDFVNNGGPAPDPLYSADMNDDGFIDQGDIDKYQDYFIYGPSVFPQYPVITVCEPDTVRGCCCKARERAVRSPAHCAADGGVYAGDGVLCGDVPLPPIVVSHVPAANATGVNKADPITITFNVEMEAIDGITITGSQSGPHLWMANYDPVTYTYSITAPFPDFMSGEVVTVMLPAPDTRSIWGVPMCTNYSWSYTIGSKMGSGTFGPPVTTYIGPGRYPADIVAADMNDDGNSDVVILFSDNACNVDSCTMWLSNGVGGGTISSVNPGKFFGSSTGKPASLCGVGDFNNDGRNDVAAVKTLDDGDYVSILMSVGAKGGAVALAPMGVYPVGFKGTSTTKPASIIADSDNDTDDDIIVVNNTDQGDVRIAVLKNVSSGTVWSSEVYIVPFSGTPVGAPSLSGGDMDGDGDQDFVVVQTLSDNVSMAVMENNGSGGCSLDGVYPTGFKGSSTTKPASIIGDMDGDGDLDVIVVDAIAGADSLALLTNNGSGGCSLDGVYPVGYKGSTSGKPASIVADVDGDGDLDVVISEAFTNGDSVAIHSNNGSGGCSFDNVQPCGFKGTSTGMPQKLIAADLDEGAALKDPAASGGLDLIHINFEACSLAVMFNQPIVTCACNCHGDPGGPCDGFTSILDVTQVVNAAFRNYPPMLDPNASCPYQTPDVNCSGSADVLDVVKMVNVAFRNGSPATEFCNPCP